jgi:sugar O-acyltransferase (sialic acid O-acetyltransferase NeuD family)
MTDGPPRIPLLIYGASGHAKVVLDAALRLEAFEVMGIVDDDPTRHGQTLFGVPILGDYAQLESPSFRRCQIVVAVGRNDARRKIVGRLAKLGCTFAAVIHPSAQIGVGASFGKGTVITAGAVVNSDTTIGDHVIINTGATVDHDCIIGDYAHIAPGVHLAGGVSVGALAHIGIGASVIQGVSIGEGSIVAAGASVVKDISAGVIVGGVPAEVLRASE